MAERILAENKVVQTVTYTLPNKHYIPVDMRYAGIDNLTPYVPFTRSVFPLNLPPSRFFLSVLFFAILSALPGAGVILGCSQTPEACHAFAILDCSGSMRTERHATFALSPSPSTSWASASPPCYHTIYQRGFYTAFDFTRLSYLGPYFSLVSFRCFILIGSSRYAVVVPASFDFYLCMQSPSVRRYRFCAVGDRMRMHSQAAAGAAGDRSGLCSLRTARVRALLRSLAAASISFFSMRGDNQRHRKRKGTTARDTGSAPRVVSLNRHGLFFPF